MKRLAFYLFGLLTLSTSAQELSSEEKELYDLVMAYRKSKGLAEIPVSPSLTQVAQTHVRDLVENKPDLKGCNAHSWSAKGEWSACCYTPDHREAECMWSKPREIAGYPGHGFEIACGSNECCSDFVMTPEYALESWQGSPGHNAVIVNINTWKSHEWNAIGIGLYKSFAVIWFGSVPDPNY